MESFYSPKSVSQLKTVDPQMRTAHTCDQGSKSTSQETSASTPNSIDPVHPDVIATENGSVQSTLTRNMTNKEIGRLSEELQLIKRDLAEEKASRARLEEILIGLANQLERHDEEMRLHLYEMRLASTSSNVSEDEPKKIQYQQLVRRIRELTRQELPRDAQILVISKGDSDLLGHYARSAMHFPQDENGEYAGYHPGSSQAAIDHLEVLKQRGFDYLVIPATSFWWLEHYDGFAAHLERNYRLLFSSEDTCLIYALKANSPWIETSEYVAAYCKQQGRFPAILDWESSVSLQRLFPECVVFPPVEPNLNILPYVEQSIEIVCICAHSQDRLEEARRVASEQVWIVDCEEGGPKILLVAAESDLEHPKTAAQESTI